MTHAGRPKLRIRRSSKHSTSGRPLCETVHAAGPNDGPNFQVKITSLPNGLIGGTSCPRRCSHLTLTRHQGDPEPKRSFRKHSLDCVSALVTDRAVEACYHLHCMNGPQPEGHMASHIGRRRFLATVGGAAAWPLAAHAQQAMPVVGYLNLESPQSDASRLTGLRRGLGRNRLR